MDTGPASGVSGIAAASATPISQQPTEAADGAAAPAARDAAPQPPAYLLRNASAADPPGTPDDAPPGEEPQPVMPAVMALVEAGEQGESPQNLSLVVEALLFAAEEAPTVSQLAQATNVSRDAIEQALDELAAAEGGGLRLQRSGNAVCLVTAPEAAPFIQRLLGLERPNKLSKAALETLAIVAYQQPVTRGAIERVRGVTCDAPLSTLRLRELIASVGQASTPGRPHLWATTPAFLDHFGLTDLSELPSLPGVPAPVTQGMLGLVGQDESDLETAAEESTSRGRAAEKTAPATSGVAEPTVAGPEPAAPAPVRMPPRQPEDLGGLAAAGGD